MIKSRHHLKKQRKCAKKLLLNNMPQEQHISKRAKRPETKAASVELREKRINIVFKIIYIFSIFFGALFINLSKGFSQGIDFAYCSFSCLAAFCLVVIWNMIVYIFHEMCCLRPEASISDNEREEAEQWYINIFQSCIASILTALFCIAFFHLASIHSLVFLAYSFFLSLGLYMCVTPLRRLNHKTYRIINSFVRPMFLTFAFSSFFLAAGLS